MDISKEEKDELKDKDSIEEDVEGGEGSKEVTEETEASDEKVENESEKKESEQSEEVAADESGEGSIALVYKITLYSRIIDTLSKATDYSTDSRIGL